MVIKKAVTVLAALFGAFLATAATAGQGDIYGGIGYGQNTLDGGVRVFGGYTVFDGIELGAMPLEIGAEVTYLDLGEDRISTFSTVSERTVNLTAVGSLRVYDNLDVYARAGIGIAEGELSVGGFLPYRQTDQGLVPALGVGAKYTFGEHVGVRLDLEQYTGMYENATSLSASVFAKF